VDNFFAIIEALSGKTGCNRAIYDCGLGGAKSPTASKTLCLSGPARNRKWRFLFLRASRTPCDNKGHSGLRGRKRGRHYPAQGALALGLPRTGQCFMTLAFSPTIRGTWKKKKLLSPALGRSKSMGSLFQC